LLVDSLSFELLDVGSNSERVFVAGNNCNANLGIGLKRLESLLELLHQGCAEENELGRGSDLHNSYTAFDSDCDLRGRELCVKSSKS